jgi:hypothetical protein
MGLFKTIKSWFCDHNYTIIRYQYFPPRDGCIRVVDEITFSKFVYGFTEWEYRCNKCGKEICIWKTGDYRAYLDVKFRKDYPEMYREIDGCKK